MHKSSLNISYSSPRSFSRAGLGCLAAVSLIPAFTSAQALRLGPLDIDAKARTEAIYTTNVEQERNLKRQPTGKISILSWGLT